MDKELKELQKQFMPEDTKAGLIQSFLDNYKGTQVCSKLIYAEALNHPFDEPKQWEIREINEIMNNCIEGWRPFSNPRSFAKYGRQRGWERIPPPDNEPSATGSNLTDGFREISEEEASQMELPFWKMTVLPIMLLPRCQVRCRENLLKVLYLQGIFFSDNESNGEIKEKSKNSK